MTSSLEGALTLIPVAIGEELDENDTDLGEEAREGLNEAASEDAPNRVLREPG